jgi:hypothetical protein
MAARIVSTLPVYIQRMKQSLRTMIEERLTKREELGETWDEAPVFPANRFRPSLFIRTGYRTM